MNIIDPTKIPKQDLPLIVLADSLTSIFNFLTRVHQKGNYGHIMLMVEPGRFVTQNLTYRSVPIEKYMTRRHRLKFWKPRIADYKKTKLAAIVKKELEAPWWRRRYDFLGIVGQAFGMPWLNRGNRFYCSERVAKNLRDIGMIIPSKPSPSALNRLFELDKDHYGVYGRWLAD